MTEPKPPFLMKLLSHFSYPQKFILIGLIFSLSLAIALYFMVESQNVNRSMTALELKGITYQYSLRKINEALLKHRIAAKAYLHGDKTIKNEIIALQGDIDTAFKGLKNYDKQNESNLELQDADLQMRGLNHLKPKELEKHWDILETQAFDITPEISDLKHFQLLESLTDLSHYIIDSSKSSLDGHINTNYLLENAFNLLPEGLSLTNQLLSLSENGIAAKQFTEEEVTHLKELSILLNSNLKQSRAALLKAFNAEGLPAIDSDSKSKLEEAQNAYFSAEDDLIRYIQARLLKIKPLEAEDSELHVLGKKAVSRYFTLWDALADQIESMLKYRLDQLTMQQEITVGLALLIFLTAFTFGLYVMRQLSLPLLNLVTIAQKLSKGDMSSRVAVLYQDEIGAVGLAFNEMAKTFEELTDKMQKTGDQLFHSTIEIANAAKKQEETVTEQEAATKQIAHSAQEILSLAKGFARTMEEVNHTAEKTSSLAVLSKADLTQMESIMHQMVDASASIAAKLAILNEKAGIITSVVSTMGKVADQTNLLSLNAAIEAEKAGEHGRSFSVIAREIRRLADQTASASLDIEKMASEMVFHVSTGVSGMERFTEEIRMNVKDASKLSGQLTKIIEQVQEQTLKVEDVNQGMQAQSLGAEHIALSIERLSESAKETTGSIRKFHDAVKQLNESAKEIHGAWVKVKAPQSKN